MKKYLFVFLALIFLASMTVQASKPNFRVLATNGTVKYKSSKGDWAIIKTGTKIYSDFKIKVGKKSYLGLIHKSGKSIEIKKSGEWTTKQLEKKLGNKSSHVAEKLAGYVMDKLGEEGDGNFNYREAMEATGAVERSFNFAKAGSSATFVELKTPRKINFSSNSANFVWLQVKDETNYIFTITDRFDRIVHAKEVTGNSYSLNSTELKLSPDEYYFWSVACKSDRTIKSPVCAFSFLSQAKIDDINKEYRQLVGELGDENSAVNQLIFGNFYEQHFLLNQAMKHYKKAVELAPDVPEYKTIYTNFLKRANL